MKKIIQFKKEILFNTKIAEITSISLEHTLNLKEEDLISGTFYISGDYKMTETSINRESFNYELPFDIALDSRFNADGLKLDIDDFYYEIINNDTLKVNIDVFIEGDMLVEEKEDRCIEEELEESIKFQKEKEEELIKNEKEQLSDEKKEEVLENKNKLNLFDNFNENETYATYSVYFVKENDTLESILEKFSVSKEQLQDYNDISSLNVNDKLIIPTTNE